MEQSQESAYQQAYAAVLNNPYWYSDKPKLLKEAFNAANTEVRAEITVDILRRTARSKSEQHLSVEYLRLSEKLSACGRIHRCGSSACLECLRAFQQAKTAAHRRHIFQLAEKYPNTLWCMVTIIPRELNYPVGNLDAFDAARFNRHFKEVLDGLRRPFLGSIDFSLESSPIGKYWQPHWHFTLHTHDPDLLRENLRDFFPAIEKYDYPVKVTEVVDLDFVPYIDKVVKIKDLFRNGRANLPELFLMLDCINPLNFLVMRDLAFTAQDDGFDFELAEP